MPVFVVKDDLSLRETLTSFMEKKRGHGHESPIVVVIALGFFFFFVCFFFQVSVSDVPKCICSKKPMNPRCLCVLKPYISVITRIFFPRKFARNYIGSLAIINSV